MDDRGRKRRGKRGREPHPDAVQVLGGTLYRVDDVAAILDISPDTVRQLIHGGELTASQIGGSYRITAQAIRAYVEDKDRQAASIAEEKRQDLERQRLLARGQKLEPLARWEEALCVWCGVTPVLCTRNDRLGGKVRCSECDDLAESSRAGGEQVSPSKDVCERKTAIRVRELDRQSEEELGWYERAERDERIARRVREAETVPFIAFKGENQHHLRERLVEQAKQRPAHWMIFQCPLCSRPQAVSRNHLKDPRFYPLCKHELPYELSRQDEFDLLRRQLEYQEAEWAGVPMPGDTMAEVYRDPHIVRAFAEMEARERNLEDGYEPDPELHNQRWELCRCAHCGETQAVAPPETRLIGQTTCRACVYRSKPISPTERVNVIVDELGRRPSDGVFRSSRCACDGRELSFQGEEPDVVLSWCTLRSERERIRLALAWVERFGIPKSAGSQLCAAVQDDLPF